MDCFKWSCFKHNYVTVCSTVYYVALCIWLLIVLHSCTFRWLFPIYFWTNLSFDLLPVLLISNYKHVVLTKKVLVKNMGPNVKDNVTNHSYGICFSGSHCSKIFISITQAIPYRGLNLNKILIVDNIIAYSETLKNLPLSAPTICAWLISGDIIA